MSAALFLIPVPLGETPLSRVLPDYNREEIGAIRHFIVENIRSARRFLKATDPTFPIDETTFYLLNKHTSGAELSRFLEPAEAGHPMGVISEAGCPAIADPGADIVAIAQQKKIRVIPLVGPSSILLALMASGFNGQKFAFHGYLPIDADQRIKALKTIEQLIYSEDQTQLFIETPYRNNQVAEQILKSCRPSTRLCIATNITLGDEMILTRTVAEWKKGLPDLNRKPTIFALYK